MKNTATNLSIKNLQRIKEENFGDANVKIISLWFGTFFYAANTGELFVILVDEQGRFYLDIEKEEPTRTKIINWSNGI